MVYTFQNNNFQLILDISEHERAPPYRLWFLRCISDDPETPLTYVLHQNIHDDHSKKYIQFLVDNKIIIKTTKDNVYEYFILNPILMLEVI